MNDYLKTEEKIKIKQAYQHVSTSTELLIIIIIIQFLMSSDIISKNKLKSIAIYKFRILVVSWIKDRPLKNDKHFLIFFPYGPHHCWS